MAWHDKFSDLIEPETHFGGLTLRCLRHRPASLNAMFWNAVQRDPSGEAVVAGLERVTYARLAEIVESLAGALSRLGLVQGDRIALVMGNRVEFLYVLLAALRIGAIAVPINTRGQTPELTYVLRHCGAKLLVHDRSVARKLPLRDLLPALRYRYCADGECHESGALAELLAGEASPPPAPEVSEEDTAVILYTSGTTGQPKGAMLTHLNIIHSSMHYALCMELGAGERTLVAVPVSHVTGLVANIFTMIGTAGCTVLLETFDAQDFLVLAAHERITHTVMVPAMFKLCLLRADFDAHGLSAWRIGAYGGSPMPEATIAELGTKLPALILVNAYGSTELASPATLTPLGFGASRADSVGVCVPCGDIRIVDDNGDEVPAGEHGEIQVAGPMVVPGYWQDEKTTAACFTRGYWKSGDIGSMDAQGFVRLHDRKKDMVIRGGYNIYSAEIENVLSAHPDVIECALVGIPDPVLGEKTRVFVHSNAAGLSAESVRTFLTARVADYKVPDIVTFSPDPLPRNASGKLLKRFLR